MSGRWPLCVDAGLPPVVHLYSLGRSPDGVFWRKEVCYAPGAGDAVHGLSAPMAALVLAFGAETMQSLKGEATDHPVLPSPSRRFNEATGIGGFPVGRIIEIFGAAASGKTTMCLTAIAAAQMLGMPCAFIDVENAYDPTWAAINGVQTDDLYVVNPAYGEQALEIADMLIRSQAFGLVVIDSVAALTPKAELENDIEDNHVGLQARMMSQGLRALNMAMQGVSNNTTLIFTNQQRTTIGGRAGSTTTGGKALPYYCSMRIKTWSSLERNGAGEVIRTEVNATIVKNRLAPPFKEATYMITNNGIDPAAELLEDAVRYGMIRAAGSHFYYRPTDDCEEYEEIKLGQGKEKALIVLSEDDEIIEDLTDRVAIAAEEASKAAKEDLRQKALADREKHATAQQKAKEKAEKRAAKKAGKKTSKKKTSKKTTKKAPEPEAEDEGFSDEASEQLGELLEDFG